MNISLTGIPLEIINKMVKLGFARTRSEAIRYAILYFGETKHLLDEDLLVKRKLDKIDKEISRGRRRTISYKEALKVK